MKQKKINEWSSIMIESLPMTFCFTDDNCSHLSTFVFIYMSKALRWNGIFKFVFYFFLHNTGIRLAWLTIYTRMTWSSISSQSALSPKMIKKCTLCQKCTSNLSGFAYWLSNSNSIIKELPISFNIDSRRWWLLFYYSIDIPKEWCVFLRYNFLRYNFLFNFLFKFFNRWIPCSIIHRTKYFIGSCFGFFSDTLVQLSIGLSTGLPGQQQRIYRRDWWLSYSIYLVLSYYLRLWHLHNYILLLYNIYRCQSTESILQGVSPSVIYLHCLNIDPLTHLLKHYTSTYTTYALPRATVTSLLCSRGGNFKFPLSSIQVTECHQKCWHPIRSQ